VLFGGIWIPAPTSFNFEAASRTITRCPFLTSAIAAPRPPRPAPQMMMLSDLVIVMLQAFSVDLIVALRGNAERIGSLILFKGLVPMDLSIPERSGTLLLLRLLSAPKPQNQEVVCGVGPRLGCTFLGSGVRNTSKSRNSSRSEDWGCSAT